MSVIVHKAQIAMNCDQRSYVEFFFRLRCIYICKFEGEEYRLRTRVFQIRILTLKLGGNNVLGVQLE